MTTWSQRAKVHFSQECKNGTTETTETTETQSVISQKGQTATTETTENPLSMVLMPQSRRSCEKHDSENLNESAANDEQPGARRLDRLSPKLLAASKALDQQILAAGLSLMPSEQPRPKLASVHKQVIQKVDTPTPRPSKVQHVDREWKPLATAYLEHHGHCAACIAAGMNPSYQRCGTGATLWSLYQSAIQ